eukprot:scaffold17291_cov62-Cylindrotheca_fusiformis.AAC.1
MEGTLSRDGTKYTEEEIEEMRLSKVWKQRYDMYLRKSFHSVQVIKENLEQWIVDWQYKEDDYGRP